MKKMFFCASLLFSGLCFAQNTDNVRPAALGISFIFNDFQTAQRIHNSSLSSVLVNKNVAKLKEMSPGIGITYFKGLTNNLDFAGTIAGSFVDDVLPGKNATNNFLLEADASVNLKLLPENYVFTPYLSAGVGASKYGGYYGAVLPVGGGFKFNLFNEASIFINARYHVPVTPETTGRHFVFGFGIAGILGNRNETNNIIKD